MKTWNWLEYPDLATVLAVGAAAFELTVLGDFESTRGILLKERGKHRLQQFLNKSVQASPAAVPASG